jgi:hypothetical protein
MRRPVRAIAESMVNTYPGVQLSRPPWSTWIAGWATPTPATSSSGPLALLKDKDRRGRLHPIVGFDPVRQRTTRTVFGEGATTSRR